MGKKVDHWFELYGKAVEDNTLQDRIEAHRLQQQQQQELHQQQLQQQQQQQSWFKSQQEGKKKFSYVQQLLLEEEEQQRREQASNWKPSSTTTTTTAITTTATSNNNLPQIPLNLLRDIVRNVLQSQGISNPSEQVLEESIQKYLQNQNEQVIISKIRFSNPSLTKFWNENMVVDSIRESKSIYSNRAEIKLNGHLQRISY